MNEKQYRGLIFLLVIIVTSAFYWFSWRPSKIKERCFAEAEFDGKTLTAKSDIERQSSLDNYYGNCIKRFGLK